ncbi:hypothetical protein L218DRAFT_1079099 [Marasmius fiardii PR-910]|nr:hypothetical protein L218DRAFT_1079099 [Marasmius fiardii PR-910]
MSSSLSSVVSNLVRASMGTSVSPSVTDDELDRHVRELLIKDAKKRAEKYGQQGIRAYLASGLSESNAPRANKRFLSSIIRSTDDHNKTVLRAQALAAEEVKQERREYERRERKARAEEAVEAEKFRSRRRRRDDSEGWDRWDGRTADRKRKYRDWETYDGDDYSGDNDSDRDRDRGRDKDSTHRSSQRHHSRSRSEERNKRSHRHTSRHLRSRETHSGSSKRHNKRHRSRSLASSQEREGKDSDHKRSDSRRHRRCDEERSSHRKSHRSRSRSQSLSREPDKKRHRDGDSGRAEKGAQKPTRSESKHKKYALSSDSELEENYDDQSRRRRWSRSPTPLSQDDYESHSGRRSTRPQTTSVTASGPSTEREAELNRVKESEKEPVVGSSKEQTSKPRKSRSSSSDTRANNGRQSSPTLSDDERMLMSPSLAPGPEPAPKLPSKMDRYFEESYDPRLDITPLSIPQVPATGLINNAEFEGWDAMLELLRVRREDKAEKKRLERMGLSKDEIKQTMYGTTTAVAGESSGSSSGVRDRWNTEGTSVMDIQYNKRGTVREWDMGKADF